MPISTSHGHAKHGGDEVYSPSVRNDMVEGYHEADNTGAIYEAPYDAQRQKNRQNNLASNYGVPAPTEMESGSYPCAELSAGPTSPQEEVTHRLA